MIPVFLMDDPTLDGTSPTMTPTDDQRARAAAILTDHVHGLHAELDDPTDGCTYPGCDDAYWLLAALQGPGPVSIEDLLR